MSLAALHGQSTNAEGLLQDGDGLWDETQPNYFTFAHRKKQPPLTSNNKLKIEMDDYPADTLNL